MKLGMRAVLGAAGVLSLAACGGSGRFVQRGINAYNVGEYGLAIEHFQYIDKEGIVLNAKGTCRYLTYRGLANIHLGKKDEGLAYLAKAKEACKPDPNWLPPEAATEMETALKKLGGQ